MKGVEMPTKQDAADHNPEQLLLSRMRLAMKALPESFFALAASEAVAHQELSAYLQNPDDTLEKALCRMVIRLAAEAKELRGGYVELLRRYPAGNRWVDTGE